MKARLEKLLRPSSIAVIGGGFWCENVIRQCRKMGYEGKIWSVHPTKSEVAGCPSVKSLDEIPAVPDAAFVGVNRDLTVDIVQQLSKMGTGGAVCFAAGFAEADAETGDGVRLQSELIDAAGEMPFLGPNCYGFINYLDGALLWPDQQGGRRIDRGVAIVTQSSNIAINMTMAARGLDLAYVVTAGNQASVALAEIGNGLLEDDRVSAIGLHIEGVGDIPAFEELAKKAHRLGKPIVVLKVGTSDAARAATVSHTASLAGSDAGASALFRRLGLARVSTIEAFLEALKIAHIIGPLASNNIASMSCSGGEASLMADLAEPLGLSFPELNPDQKSALRQGLGPRVRLANPLDYNTYIWPDTDKMAQVFTGMMQAELSLGIVVLDFPRTDRCSDADWAHVVDAVEQTAQASKRPMAILASMAENMPEQWAMDCAARGIVPLCGMGPGLEAVSALVALAPAMTAGSLLPARVVGQTCTWNEKQAKDHLRSFGVAVPNAQLVHTKVDAVSVARAIGYPVVAKGLGHAHKTEVDAVRVGLIDDNDVALAIEQIGGSGWIIEEMITDCVAELLVGVTLDPAHGYVLTLGAGGQLTEIWADTVSLLLPATHDDIGKALSGLRIAPLLSGYRGKPGANLDAVVSAVMAVQDCVLAAQDRIVEVEVNPLIAGKDRAVAVDALIVMEEEK
jgi:acyl-CoA synthetase (NDP forming)